jgi:demethylmenaquinone methyltransferase/2-methoxy-6-polyprenyl-1,4-benzoquinol methylase
MQDKAHYMQRLFGGAPKEYDSLLSHLTLRNDSAWRGAVLNASGLSIDGVVLDVATGTGLMAFDFASKLDEHSLVVGVDLCEPMLRKGFANVREKGEGRVTFVAGRGESLPFADGVFDCASITLALRNVTDAKQVLQEMTRVVKDGGTVICLDFCRPQLPVFRSIYSFHIFHVLPFIGKLVSKEWKEILDYLAGSIKRSLAPSGIAGLMEEAGLSQVSIARFTMGIVSLVKGVKPKAILALS